MRSVMDDLVRSIFYVLLSPKLNYFFGGISQGLSNDIVGSSSIFSGEEEVFAFARACSRLVQMGSKEWAETAGQL